MQTIRKLMDLKLIANLKQAAIAKQMPDVMVSAARTQIICGRGTIVSHHGNDNSVVDAADFVTWRKKLGDCRTCRYIGTIQTGDLSVATNTQAVVLPEVAVAKGAAPVAAEVADTKTRISNLEFSFPLTTKPRETHRAAPRPADANAMNSIDNQNFMLIDARDGTRGISSSVASQHPIRHKATDDAANDSVFSNDDLESMLIGCLVHELDQDKLPRYSASNTTTRSSTPLLN